MLNRILRLLVTVLLPYFMVILPVRIAMQPWIVPFEYALPGFPPDPVGALQPPERLRLGLEGLNGVVQADGHQRLMAMRFNNGERAFVDREVKHLDDVRDLLNVLFPLHTVAALVLVIGVAALAKRSRATLAGALRGASLVTFIVITLTVLFAGVGWDIFFTTFHRLLFTGDTWLFNWDDTLIRLYPVEFWQIATGMVGAFILAECLVAWNVAGRMRRALRA